MRTTVKKLSKAVRAELLHQHFLQEARRMSEHEAVMVGFFDYREANDGWADTFRVVDDDGMPFVLSSLKRYQGVEVRITIEPLRRRPREDA